MADKKTSKSSSRDDQTYIVEELKQANDSLSSLQIENHRLKEVIRENDLEEELDLLDRIPLEEQICINGLVHLAPLFENGSFTKEDVQALDLIYKNYRMAKGLSDGSKKKKEKPANVAELMKIVKEVKDN